jgi:hypothetical protein
MYSILSTVEALSIKSQVREQIFSLLGNTGKTLFSDSISLYAEIHTSWYQKIAWVISNIWHTPYKRILTYISIVLTSLVVAPPDTSFAAAGETATFIVTAYYSPIPWQNSYARGSLAADKKLNGNGTNGASGTPVFTGMIAAPKSYDFGTHIFFEGLWLWRVEDRWGAIVDAWVRGQPHDRIDIWMGHGDVGLKRARAWWVREVTGTFVTAEQAKNLNPIDLEGISNGRVNLADFPTTRAQSQGGISAEIIEAFAELGYIVQWGNVKDMIFRFQVDQGILTSLSDDGAGNFGPKTKIAFSKEYTTYSDLKKLDIEAIEKARKELLDERTAWDIRYQKAQNSVEKFSTIKRWDAGNNVFALQSILSEEGFFKGKIDWQMKPHTLLALRQYQKANGLKQTGKIDPSTKEALIIDILEA